MNYLDRLEYFLIVLVSRIAPWAAPLAPAYLVARSIQAHFQAPLWAGVAVGVTLEAVGVASAHVTLEMWNYNTDPERVKSDPHAPFWLGLVATAVYFVSGIVLTVLLEVVPESVKVAPALFFVLAGIAYITLALISGHARRLEQVTEAKRSRSRTRPDSPVTVRRWADKAAFLSDPGRASDLTTADIVELAGVTDRTARRWLADAGKNGNE